MNAETQSAWSGDGPPDAGWQALRAELADVHAPDAIEAKLLAAFRQQHKPGWSQRLRRLLSPSRWALLPLGGAMAAMLLATLWWRPLLLERGHRPLTETVPAATVPQELTTTFFPVGDPQRIATTAHARMVRVSLPRAVLADYGLPVSPELADQPVEADLLVGDDGATMALRFVRNNPQLM